MKRIHLWKTVRGRLLSLVIGFEVLILAVLIINSIRLLHGAMTSQIQAQAQQITPVLIAALTAPLAQRDYATMQAVIDESRTRGGLEYIVVEDRLGHRIAATDESDRLMAHESHHDFSLFADLENPYYRVTEPIDYQGQRLGRLLYGIDLSRIVKARQTLLVQGIGIAAIEIFISSVILLVVGLWLTRHMKSLTRASLEVASGNLSPLAVPEGEDDVGRLGVAFNIMSRAITERVSELTDAKETAEAREAQLRGITDSASDGILMMNPKGNISFWNPAAEKIFGYRTDEAIGRNLHNLLAPQRYQADYTAALSRFLGNGQGNAVEQSLEIYALRKDGVEIPIALSISAVHLNGEWHAVGIVRDISEIRQVQEQLALKQEQLESLNRSLQKRVEAAVTELRMKDEVLISQGRQAAMGEMIGNIAHQWRQPLNDLALMIADLQSTQQHGELTEAYMDETVTAANQRIQRMSSTIDDFRNFFHPDKKMAVFSAKEQIKLAVAMVEVAFRNNLITITVADADDCLLQGYPNEYSQVLLNLLNNAKDAIVQVGANPGRIDIFLREENGMGVMTMRDNGGGIAKRFLDKIFEPYFSTKNAGTGIGLYMSKTIIERNMKGRLEVRLVNDGTEFSINVPLAVQ